ncbi:hypothetical protein D3C78_734770 [compost metagenome]
MDFVDEQHVMGFEVGQQGSQVTRAFEDRPRSALDRHAHLLGNDIGQGGLAQPRRAEDQRVVEGFVAPAGGLDEQGHLFAHHRLADVFGQAQWTDRPVLDLFSVAPGGGYQSIGFNHLDHSLKAATDQLFTAQALGIHGGHRLAGFLGLIAQGNQRADGIGLGAGDAGNRQWTIGHKGKHGR